VTWRGLQSYKTHCLHAFHIASISEAHLHKMNADTDHGNGPTTYHKHLPDLDIPRFQIMKTQNAHEYADEFLKKGHQPPWLYALYKHWRGLFEEPFKGITNDGGCGARYAAQ